MNPNLKPHLLISLQACFIWQTATVRSGGRKQGTRRVMPTMPTHTCRENCHWWLAGKVPCVFTTNHTCLPWEMTSPFLKNLSQW